MNLIEIKDLYENKENFIDKEIEVGGWVRSIRDSKTFGFIVLNDGCKRPETKLSFQQSTGLS